MQYETELETYLLGEIINHKSNDYLQTYYFTHKCVDGNGEIWYQAYTQHTVEHTTSLWFRNGEIEWFDGVE